MSEKKIRVQDNLYEYVNYKELLKKEIPDDLPCIGGFMDLDLFVENKMMNEFNKLSKDTKSISDPFLKKAIEIYNIVLNNNQKPENVINQLFSGLDEIEKIKDIKTFNKNLANLYKKFCNLPFVLEVSPDMKSTSNHALYISGPKTILPDTSYYQNNHPSKKQLISIWVEMVKKILSFFTNISEDEKEIKIKNALKFDEEIARIVKSRVEWADYIKSYNPMKFSESKKILDSIDFEGFITKMFKKIPEKIIVTDPRFLENFSKLFNEKNLDLYRDWSYIKYVINNSEYLCEDLRIISGMYSRALRGTKSNSSINKYAYRLVAFDLLYEPIGIYFGKKYLGETAKKDVISIVKGLINSYKERLSENEWLSPETKNKAILKLNKMTLKIGYPDSLSNFYKKLKLSTENKTLLQIINYVYSQKRNFENSLLYKKVDRTLWLMPGHMVNACYNPTSNDITFPAAILQPPFYSIKQSRAKNFGGIGTVIGHEISHAFDNNGAQCDEDGNLNNWWTKKDYEKFKVKTQKMINQFEGLPLGNGKVNGTLVVSENIADLGGIASSLQTMESEKKDVNYEDFFFNYAKIWAQKSRSEYAELLLSIDVHAPAYWRANMPPRNFEQWYKTFNVSSKDEMYLPENKRIVIW